MKWEDYYEKINEWSIATSKSRMSSLEDIGSSDEVIDAINRLAYDDETVATKLLKKAVEMNVTFSGEELAEISNLCEEPVLKMAFDKSARFFTEEDLEDMYGCIDDEWIEEVAKGNGLNLPEDLRDEEYNDGASIAIGATYDAAILTLNSLIHLQQLLNDSEGISVVDMLTKSFFPSLIKHQALHEVEAQAKYTRALIDGLNGNLKSILNIDRNIRLTNIKLSTAIDLWFDSGFLDCIVHLNIGKMKKQVRYAIRQVEDIAKALEQMM